MHVQTLSREYGTNRMLLVVCRGLDSGCEEKNNGWDSSYIFIEKMEKPILKLQLWFSFHFWFF